MSLAHRRPYPETVSDRPAGDPPELPPDVPPEYADEYLRGYERAYAEAAGLASAAPLPGQVPEPAEGEDDQPAVAEEPEQPEQPEEPPEPWQFEEPEDPELPRTWAFEPPEVADVDDAVDPDDEPTAAVPGFVLWEGRDERYDEPPDVEGYPRWVMPFLAVCLIVLLFVAAYLLA